MLFGTRFAPIWSCSCAIMQDERYNVGAVRLPGRGGRELLDRMDGSRGTKSPKVPRSMEA
jgi:hypothetical protein